MKDNALQLFGWQQYFRGSWNLGYHPASLVGDNLNLDGQRELISTPLDYLGFTAAQSIGNLDLGANSVAGYNIQNATIGSAQIANASITSALIGNGAITTANIASLAVTDAKIASMTASKLTAGTIDASVITVTNLNASNITTGFLSANYISGGTLNFTNITATNLSANSITTGTLNGVPITNSNIGTGSNWQGNTIANAYIGNLVADKITSGTLNCGLLTVTNLNAGSITSGSLSGDRISGGRITGANISIGVSSSDPFAVYGTSIRSDGTLTMGADIGLNNHNINGVTTIWAYNFNNRSDVRLKENIQDYIHGLDKTLQLHPVSFRYNKGSDLDSHIGLVAQEVEKIVPEIVKEDKDGFKYISYNELIPVLVKAIQELYNRVENE